MGPAFERSLRAAGCFSNSVGSPDRPARFIDGPQSIGLPARRAASIFSCTAPGMGGGGGGSGCLPGGSIVIRAGVSAVADGSSTRETFLPAFLRVQSSTPAPALGCSLAGMHLQARYLNPIQRGELYHRLGPDKVVQLLTGERVARHLRLLPRKAGHPARVHADVAVCRFVPLR
jgi:hypothetical protein